MNKSNKTVIFAAIMNLCLCAGESQVSVMERFNGAYDNPEQALQAAIESSQEQLELQQALEEIDAIDRAIQASLVTEEAENQARIDEMEDAAELARAIAYSLELAKEQKAADSEEPTIALSTPDVAPDVTFVQPQDRFEDIVDIIKRKDGVFNQADLNHLAAMLQASPDSAISVKIANMEITRGGEDFTLISNNQVRSNIDRDMYNLLEYTTGFASSFKFYGDRLSHFLHIMNQKGAQIKSVVLYSADIHKGIFMEHTEELGFQRNIERIRDAALCVINEGETFASVFKKSGVVGDLIAMDHALEQAIKLLSHRVECGILTNEEAAIQLAFS